MLIFFVAAGVIFVSVGMIGVRLSREFADNSMSNLSIGIIAAGSSITYAAIIGLLITVK